MTLNYEDLEYINVLGKKRSFGILGSAILESSDWRDISKIMYAIFIKREKKQKPQTTINTVWQFNDPST